LPECVTCVSSRVCWYSTADSTYTHILGLQCLLAGGSLIFFFFSLSFFSSLPSSSLSLFLLFDPFSSFSFLSSLLLFPLPLTRSHYIIFFSFSLYYFYCHSSLPSPFRLILISLSFLHTPFLLSLSLSLTHTLTHTHIHTHTHSYSPSLSSIPCFNSQQTTQPIFYFYYFLFSLSLYFMPSTAPEEAQTTAAPSTTASIILSFFLLLAFPFFSSCQILIDTNTPSPTLPSPPFRPLLPQTLRPFLLFLSVYTHAHIKRSIGV
jgi:hypothetical protein